MFALHVIININNKFMLIKKNTLSEMVDIIAKFLLWSV